MAEVWARWGGVLVASSSGERVPGQTATGNVPSNVSDQLAAAQQDIAQGKAVDALKLYDQVLKQDPNNAQALTFRGWILESANLHDEALQSLDKALAADPTFAMAPVFARMNGLEPVPVPLGPDFDADPDALLATGARVIYLCSPNNPTGTTISPSALERVAAEAPGLVILDQAYREFETPAGTPCPPEPPRSPPLQPPLWLRSSRRSAACTESSSTRRSCTLPTVPTSCATSSTRCAAATDCGRCSRSSTRPSPTCGGASARLG